MRWSRKPACLALMLCALPVHALQAHVYHYYCSSDMQQQTLYFSAPFDTADTDVNKIREAFRTYLAEKYSYSSDDPPVCAGNYASAEEVQAVIDKRVGSMVNVNRWTVVQTGWAYGGTAAKPKATESANTQDGKAAKEDDADDGSDDDDAAALAQASPALRSAVQQEMPLSRAFCKANPLVSGLFECGCFSTMVRSYRLKHAQQAGSQPNPATAGSTNLNFAPLTDILPKLDPRDCIDEDLIGEWVATQVHTSGAGKRAEQVTECAAANLAEALRNNSELGDIIRDRVNPAVQACVK